MFSNEAIISCAGLEVKRRTKSHELDGACIGSISHDIGKCSVPRELLHKATPLTLDERKRIEHHTLAGYALMHYYTDNASTALSAEIARDHHASKNGTGYPAGKKLPDLRTEIVIASDIYDALLSERPCRRTPYDNRTALEELSSKALEGRIPMPVIQALVSCSRKGSGTGANASCRRRSGELLRLRTTTAGGAESPAVRSKNHFIVFSIAASLSGSCVYG